MVASSPPLSFPWGENQYLKELMGCYPWPGLKLLKASWLRACEGVLGLVLSCDVI